MLTQKTDPQTGPVFWTPKRGSPFGETVRAFAAAFLRLTRAWFFLLAGQLVNVTWSCI